MGLNNGIAGKKVNAHMKSRWDIFYEGIQKDIKLWMFLLGIMCLYRAIFIITMQEYMTQSVVMADVGKAMWIGFRISLKSAGALAVVSFIFCTMGNVIFPKFKLASVRINLGRFYIFVLSILLMARYPYYQEFHATFNQNVYNTFKEDFLAMVVTAVQEYELIERMIVVIILLAIIGWLLKKWLSGPAFQFPQFNQKIASLLVKLGLILFIGIFMLFIRFGGSFNYAHSINWQNAGMTRDYFLNEAVLDDVQALYRAKSENQYAMQGSSEGIEQDNVKKFAQAIASDQIYSEKLDDYFLRKAHGAKIDKPNHIFIIIGESYAQWPLEEKYSDLHIADGIKKIIAQENAFYSSHFIPVGAFTADTLNGLVTGMAVAGIYPAYQAETYKGIYGTAFAKQFKNLGYKTVFWHGGYASSGKIKDLVLAQGFDEYIDAGDMDLVRTNIWGAKDGLLLDGVEQRFEKEIPTVNVIMTVINHPPYNLDATAEGFERSKVKAAIPESMQKDEDILNMLGSYWYMDKVISSFVERMYNKYPDSLFIITGDHADRRNLTPNPSLYEQYTIPFVLYGQGISKDILAHDIAGNHLNIAPTLIELIAPKDYEYYSIFDSFTNGVQGGFSHKVWITDKAIGRLNSNEEEKFPISAGLEVDFDAESQKAYQRMAMQRTLSWWRVAKGNSF